MIFRWSQNAHTNLLKVGEGARLRVGARALSRGSLLEQLEQCNDDSKAGAAGKRDVQCVTTPATDPGNHGISGVWMRKLRKSVTALG
jgi:hypothetical protein